MLHFSKTQIHNRPLTRISAMNCLIKFTLGDLEVLARLHRCNTWTSMHRRLAASYCAHSYQGKHLVQLGKLSIPTLTHICKVNVTVYFKGKFHPSRPLGPWCRGLSPEIPKLHSASPRSSRLPPGKFGGWGWAYCRCVAQSLLRPSHESRQFQMLVDIVF